MKYLFFTLFATALFTASAQDADIPAGHDLYHYLDRIDIRGYTDQVIDTDLKPYSRSSLRRVFGQVEESRLHPSERGWHARMRVLADDTFANQEQNKGILNAFYRNQRDLYQVREKDLELYINPVLHLAGGMDRTDFDGMSENLPISHNSRGVVVRGSAFGKVGFYTEVYDNVTRVPRFLFQRYEQSITLPGEGFVKRFGEDNGLDYFSSRAYVTYSPVPQVRIKFGKDRASWGNGYQSLLLSDHSNDYLLLNVYTRIWKLEYTNHFTQMIDFIRNRNDTEGTFPRKYAVFHQLAYKPNRHLSIGIFESIVYSPHLANGARGFELQYLNPIIFYRSVEQSLGSPDNSLLGLNLKYNFLKHVQAYGQLLLDDFNFSVRDQGSGYWGNKVGYQVGMKYIDAFTIPTLDLQVEYNRVRPYTYQHFNISANYLHYGQSLGHAAGANLYDYHFILRYHPLPAWNLLLAYSHSLKGLDEGGINYGGDAEKSYVVGRPGDFNNVVGQGQQLEMDMLYGRLSFQLGNTDIYADLEGRYRRENELTSTSLLGGIRVHFSPGRMRY